MKSISSSAAKFIYKQMLNNMTVDAELIRELMPLMIVKAYF